MTDAEIEVLKQIETELRSLEAEQKALQNQIVAILSAQLTTTTALLNLLRCNHPRSEETRQVNNVIGSLRGLKTSIDRKLDARRG